MLKLPHWFHDPAVAVQLHLCCAKIPVQSTDSDSTWGTHGLTRSLAIWSEPCQKNVFENTNSLHLSSHSAYALTCRCYASNIITSFWCVQISYSVSHCFFSRKGNVQINRVYEILRYVNVLASRGSHKSITSMSKQFSSLSLEWIATQLNFHCLWW